MTALCGGGTSGPIQGTATNLVISAGLITAGLLAIDPLLAPFAALIDGFTYDLLSSCSTDPPAQPTWTFDDFRALTLGFLDPNFQTAIGKLRDQLIIWLWHQYCECNTVSTPAFVLPTLPTNVTIPTIGTAQPCGSGAAPFNGVYQFIQSGTGIADGGAAFPLPRTTVWWLGHPWTAWVLPVPLPAEIDLELEITAPVSGQTASASLAYFSTVGSSSADGTFVAIHTGSTFSSGTRTLRDTAIPASARYAIVDLNSTPPQSAPFGFASTVSVTAYCGSGGSSGSASPCITDPATLTLLQQIYQLVTLLQRYTLPFAYILGAAHSGLSGSGSFAISRLQGMRCHLTSRAIGGGESAGVPNYLFDQGWMSIETADGLVDQVRITAVDQVWQSRLFSEAVTFGYYLQPGCVATFTEVEAEP